MVFLLVVVLHALIVYLNSRYNIAGGGSSGNIATVLPYSVPLFGGHRMALGCSGLHANCFLMPIKIAPHPKFYAEFAPPYLIWSRSMICMISLV